MTNKQIKQLAAVSFIRGSIDPKRVLKIASKLKRGELRQYIKYLKSQVAKKTVYVQMPNLEQIDQGKIRKIFPDKKVVFQENPDILLGIRIIDNDKIYDFNLKDSFEEMSERFSQI